VQLGVIAAVSGSLFVHSLDAADFGMNPLKLVSDNAIAIMLLVTVSAAVYQSWDSFSFSGHAPTPAQTVPFRFGDSPQPFRLGESPQPSPAGFTLAAMALIGVLFCSLVVLCSYAGDNLFEGSAFSSLGGWSSPPPEPGAVGLYNLGNTCYVNSTLVAVAQVAPLASYFLSGEFKHHINIRNASGAQGQVAHAYARLMESLWRGSQAAVSPSDFHVRTSAGRADS
jgi:hypothetical protein